MNITVANTINFAKDSLNLAKETAVNYGGRAITQLKHLPVTMHEDFRVACGVTATVTAVALVAGNYLGKKISGKANSLLAGELTLGVTLASAYAGLYYATGFPQNKIVSALIVVSLTALRCFLTISTIQAEFRTIQKERDNLRANEANIQRMQGDLQKREKDFESTIQTLQQENDKLREFNSKFMQENSELTERNTKANSGYQNLQAEIDALKQERDVLRANEDQTQQRVKALQEKVETLEKNTTTLEQSLG